MIRLLIVFAAITLFYPFRSSALTVQEILSDGGFCIAQAVSEDGQTVALSVQKQYGPPTLANDAIARAHLPALWRDGKIIPLETNGVAPATTSGISGDGRIVSGAVRISAEGEVAVRWVNGIMEKINIPGIQSSSASNISEDGTSVIGTLSFYGQSVGFVWRQNDVEYLNNLNFPYDTSGDGNVIAGSLIPPNTWAQATVLNNGSALAPIKSATISEAKAVSSDGKSIVVEYQYLNDGLNNGRKFGLKLFQDDRSIDLLPLGNLAPGAVRISGDGRLISTALKDWNNLSHHSTIVLWREQNGWKQETFQDILEFAKIDAHEWTFQVPTGLSRNGVVLVGNGTFKGRQTPWLLDFNASEPLIPLCQ